MTNAMNEITENSDSNNGCRYMLIIVIYKAAIERKLTDVHSMGRK